MKLSHIAAAAGLFIASLGVAGTADAQPYHGDRGHSGYHHDDRGDRWDGDHRGHGNRGWDGDRRGHGDRGWHGNRGWHDNRGWQRHCRTEWRHHHRVRICR